MGAHKAAPCTISCLVRHARGSIITNWNSVTKEKCELLSYLFSGIKECFTEGMLLELISEG